MNVPPTGISSSIHFNYSLNLFSTLFFSAIYFINIFIYLNMITFSNTGWSLPSSVFSLLQFITKIHIRPFPNTYYQNFPSVIIIDQGFEGYKLVWLNFKTFFSNENNWKFWRGSSPFPFHHILFRH